MRAIKGTLLAGGAVALAFAGHGALDAFADQKAEEAIEQIRRALPDGTVLSYDAVDGDPYNTGATINNLQITSPAMGTFRADNASVAGVSLNGQGQISAIQTVAVENWQLLTLRSVEVEGDRFELLGLEGESLARTLQQNLSIEDLLALDYEKLTATRLAAKQSDIFVTTEQIDLQVDDKRQLNVKLDQIEAQSATDGVTLSAGSALWQGHLPSPEQIDNNHPESLVSALPARLELSGLSAQNQEFRLDLRSLVSAIEADGDQAISTDYKLQDLTLLGAGPTGDLGNQIDLEGQTRIDLASGISEGAFLAGGAGLGQADVSFRARGIEGLAGFVAGAPITASGQQQPALLGLRIDYRDEGLADHIITGMAGESDAERGAFADQMQFFASAFMGGNIPSELVPLIDELREFIIEPQQISIELDPAGPIRVANILVASLTNPAGIPALLGLKLDANP